MAVDCCCGNTCNNWNSGALVWWSIANISFLFPHPYAPTPHSIPSPNPFHPHSSATKLYTPLSTSVSMSSTTTHCLLLGNDIESTRLQKYIITCKKANKVAFKETKNGFVDYDWGKHEVFIRFARFYLNKSELFLKNQELSLTLSCVFLRTYWTFLKNWPICLDVYFILRPLNKSLVYL
jgi:hypothetical protein